MTRLFSQLIPFIIIALIIQLLIGKAYLEFISRQSNSFRKQEQLEAMDPLPEILFLGDSHVERAVDPRHIPGSFNYSSSGESYYQTFSKIARIEESEILKNLHTVILPFERHSFSSFLRTQVKDDAYWTEILDYWDFARETRDFKLLGKLLKGKLFPHLGGIEEAYFVFRGGHRQQEIFKGFLPSNRLLDVKKAEDDPGRVKFHFENRVIPDEFLVRHFLQSLYRLDAEGLKIVLVMYPVHRTYLLGADTYLNKLDYQEFQDSLLASLPEKIRVLDYSTFGEGKDHLFRDSDHLNLEGARLFSELLNTELRK